MGDIYMTKELGAKLVKLVLGGFVLLLGVIVIVFAQSYFGRQSLEEAEEKARVALVNSQRSGCERAKQDRRVNARGWRTAETARLRSLAQESDISFAAATQLIEQDPKPDDPFDLVAAREYDQLAAELEGRSEINCAEVFPLDV